jgi:hypothetical protein
MAQPVTKPASQLFVHADTLQSCCLLTVSGVLNGVTYLELRNTVIKAAMDQPQAVLVDVTQLWVPTSSAWSVFTSARWHVRTWPDVPIMLTCAHEDARDDIARNGVARYVPVYPSAEIALARLVDRGQPFKQRSRAELPAVPSSLRRARELVAEVLLDWSLPELVAVAKVIVNVFVENVLEHTDSAPVLRLETDGTTVSVAVQDESALPPVRHEDGLLRGERVSGLSIVAALSRVWGTLPAPSGKTVWAVVGPENKL